MKDPTGPDSDATGEVEAREAAHWDALADLLTPEDLPLEHAVTDPLGQRRLELLGDLRSKRVLDVGCGTGLWAVVLAQRGAEVWAVDISPRSIALTRRRASLHGVEDRVHARVMSAMKLEYADRFFDLVHGQDIIHHVDAARLAAEIARVLALGGRAVFIENCANNRLLLLARRLLCGRWGIPRWSSEDEHPLTRERLNRFQASFRESRVEYPLFMFFHLVDAYLLRFRNRWVSRLCSRLDDGIHRYLPFLRPYSYRQLILCQSPVPRPAPEYASN